MSVRRPPVPILALIMTLWTVCASARIAINTEFSPSSSLVDYAFLLDPPAGRHGFLTVDSRGRFVWPSGARARFWGVNISRKSVFVEDAAIVRAVETLAHSGVNLVRFEAIDAPGGLFERGSPTMALERLQTLDRWTALLRERGIYYYLDLLDLREFSEADGVPSGGALGPGARPYAMFDATLIRLQKDFARQLLTRRNVFTGVRYVDDPALAVVEICNESGFFLRSDATDRLSGAQSRPGHPLHSYAADLAARWNRWLRGRYPSRTRLAAAWGPNLAADEDPGSGTVRLPRLQEAVSGSRKRTDYVRFLSDLQRSYFSNMRAYLRSIGLRVPVTGVTSSHLLADATSWSPLDFTAGNYFHDHPTFAGKEWVGSLHFSDTNPLRARSAFQSAPYMGALRWGAKPVVIREWAQPWPNRYRAVAAPEVLAYASLQDLDGLLLFGYRTVPPASGQPALADFAHEADPTVWALFGACGLAFRRGDIRPGERTVTLDYAPQEVFRWPAMIGERVEAAWHERITSRLGHGATPPRSTKGSPLVSSTGQIARHVQDGVLTVNAPRLKAIVGEFGGKPWILKDGGHSWELTTRSPIGALMVQSLDGQPLRSSRRWHAIMVTRADNTGQRFEAMKGSAPGRFRIAATGRAPVITGGKRFAGGLAIRRDGKPWLSLDLIGGTWELLVEPDGIAIACDTDGIPGALLGRRFVTRADTPVEIAP